MIHFCLNSIIVGISLLLSVLNKQKEFALYTTNEKKMTNWILLLQYWFIFKQIHLCVILLHNEIHSEIRTENVAVFLGNSYDFKSKCLDGWSHTLASWPYHLWLEFKHYFTQVSG